MRVLWFHINQVNKFYCQRIKGIAGLGFLKSSNQKSLSRNKEKTNWFSIWELGFWIYLALTDSIFFDFEADVTELGFELGCIVCKATATEMRLSDMEVRWNRCVEKEIWDCEREKCRHFAFLENIILPPFFNINSFRIVQID